MLFPFQGFMNNIKWVIILWRVHARFIAPLYFAFQFYCRVYPHNIELKPKSFGPIARSPTNLNQYSSQKINQKMIHLPSKPPPRS